MDYKNKSCNDEGCVADSSFYNPDNPHKTAVSKNIIHTFEFGPIFNSFSIARDRHVYVTVFISFSMN